MTRDAPADVPSLSPAIESRDPEALAIYLLIGLLGAVRVIVAIVRGETFGGEDTLAVAMIIAGSLGALRHRR
jgi:hypothetical protein